MKKEQDWSVSYTIGWGGESMSYVERASFIINVAHSSIPVVIENEELPFTFFFLFARRTKFHPSIRLLLQPSLFRFYLVLFGMLISLFMSSSFILSLPPYFSGFSLFLYFLNFFLPETNSSFLLLSADMFFFILWLDSEGGVFFFFVSRYVWVFAAIAVCIQACVRLQVQSCVQGTETCPNRRTTRGLFPIIPQSATWTKLPHKSCAWKSQFFFTL